MTFSFLRGLNEDARYQKLIRMGTVVKMPKKMLVFNPPPIFQEKYVGTPAAREMRTRLEKLSLPAPSAGRGAFLMEGYCHEKLADVQLIFAEAITYFK